MRIFPWLLLAAIASALEPSPYEVDVSKWRADREARLKADDGWLTVVGLHWLKEGPNQIPAPANFGTFTLAKNKVHFKPAPGVALKEMDLKPDTEPNYDVLSVGRVKAHIIRRADRFAVRVKDNDSATRKRFTHLDWFPIDPSWKIRAKFVPWKEPHTLTFDTEVGVKEEDPSPGYVVFERYGKEYRLDAVKDEDSLFFVLRDSTAGKTTYPASRFLYTALPKNGLVDLDFNKAENPPCVFTDFATCPLPPSQNRLTLAITAGEKLYRR